MTFYRRFHHAFRSFSTEDPAPRPPSKPPPAPPRTDPPPIRCIAMIPYRELADSSKKRRTDKIARVHRGSSDEIAAQPALRSRERASWARTAFALRKSTPRAYGTNPDLRAHCGGCFTLKTKREQKGDKNENNIYFYDGEKEDNGEASDVRCGKAHSRPCFSRVSAAVVDGDGAAARGARRRARRVSPGAREVQRDQSF